MDGLSVVRDGLMRRRRETAFSAMDSRIDADHLALFKLLDRMATHRRATDLDELNLLLDQLLDHTFGHFAREEQTMRAWGYPGAARHAQEHEAMRTAFIESLRRVVKGGLSTPAFLQHAKESFTYHFDTADMVFIHWLQANQPAGAGQGPESLPGSLGGIGAASRN